MLMSLCGCFGGRQGQCSPNPPAPLPSAKAAKPIPLFNGTNVRKHELYDDFIAAVSRSVSGNDTINVVAAPVQEAQLKKAGEKDLSTVGGSASLSSPGQIPRTLHAAAGPAFGNRELLLRAGQTSVAVSAVAASRATEECIGTAALAEVPESAKSAPPTTARSSIPPTSHGQLKAELGEMQFVGQGATGLVYRASVTQLCDGSKEATLPAPISVAVKFMICNTPQQLWQRAKEALLSKLVSHPNLVRTLAMDVTLVTPNTYREWGEQHKASLDTAAAAAVALIPSQLLPGAYGPSPALPQLLTTTGSQAASSASTTTSNCGELPVRIGSHTFRATAATATTTATNEAEYRVMPPFHGNNPGNNQQSALQQSSVGPMVPIDGAVGPLLVRKSTNPEHQEHLSTTLAAPPLVERQQPVGVSVTHPQEQRFQAAVAAAAGGCSGSGRLMPLDGFKRVQQRTLGCMLAASTGLNTHPCGLSRPFEVGSPASEPPCATEQSELWAPVCSGSSRSGVGSATASKAMSVRLEPSWMQPCGGGGAVSDAGGAGQQGPVLRLPLSSPGMSEQEPRCGVGRGGGGTGGGDISCGANGSDGSARILSAYGDHKAGQPGERNLMTEEHQQQLLREQKMALGHRASAQMVGTVGELESSGTADGSAQCTAGDSGGGGASGVAQTAGAALDDPAAGKAVEPAAAGLAAAPLSLGGPPPLSPMDSLTACTSHMAAVQETHQPAVHAWTVPAIGANVVPPSVLLGLRAPHNASRDGAQLNPDAVGQCRSGAAGAPENMNRSGGVGGGSRASGGGGGSQRAEPVPFQDILYHMDAQPGRFLAKVIMEYCDSGTLLPRINAGDYVAHPDKGPLAMLSATRALLCCLQEIVAGMAHMHALNVIHGDLKPGNVLLTTQAGSPLGYVCKVSDFGLATALEASEQTISHENWGTLVYMAPESCAGRCRKASDVYSFGVLLWQMCTGERPYAGLQAGQVLLGVKTGNLKLEWPAWVSKSLVKVGQACLRFEPKARPGFKGIRSALLKLTARLDGKIAAAETAGMYDGFRVLHDSVTSSSTRVGAVGALPQGSGDGDVGATAGGSEVAVREGELEEEASEGKGPGCDGDGHGVGGGDII